MTSAFRKACKRAKIKDLRLHDLRHDAATRFWKTHKDLALLKEFLGDRDTESVMRYVNIAGKEASRLMRKRRSVLGSKASCRGTRIATGGSTPQSRISTDRVAATPRSWTRLPPGCIIHFAKKIGRGRGGLRAEREEEHDRLPTQADGSAPVHQGGGRGCSDERSRLSLDRARAEQSDQDRHADDLVGPRRPARHLVEECRDDRGREIQRGGRAWRTDDRDRRARFQGQARRGGERHPPTGQQ